ncbi:MAG: DUF2254 domain-containing protein [Roseobacter sp.]
MSRLNWMFLIVMRYYRNLGLRVSFYALLSLLAALSGPSAQRVMGLEAASRLGFDSVLPVLSILATSMLAVSTFSLNIMVSAHRSAAAATTPRVQRILLDDTTTQSVLATFIGAFVFSLTSIVLYQARFYTEDTAIIVMAVTVVVVVLVVVSMLRWIHHLTDLGSVDNSVRAVHVKASESLAELAKFPTFGAAALTSSTVLPTKMAPLYAPQSGYIQLIDVARLQECLPPQGAIYISQRPGAYVLEGQIIAHISGQLSKGGQTRLSKAFTLGTQRTFEQDALYGLVVMSEIASKALSPGINDAGTAIAAIHSLNGLLWDFTRVPQDASDLSAPRVFMPCVDPQHLVDAAFAPIARDGAGVIEVATNLRQALARLATSRDEGINTAARVTAQKAQDQTRHAGKLMEWELEKLSQIKV